MRVNVCDTITDELLALRAELEENTARLPLSPAELRAAAEDLLPRAAAAAKERQREAIRERDERGRATTSDQRSEVAPGQRAREEVAAALGTSPSTLDRVNRVYEAAGSATCRRHRVRGAPPARARAPGRAAGAWPTAGSSGRPPTSPPRSDPRP